MARAVDPLAEFDPLVRRWFREAYGAPSPPHILITTPESLNIMLTSERARTIFSGTRTVIVDEIHALAGNKRGAHLALTLERLEHQIGSSPQRIGLRLGVLSKGI